MFLPFLLFLGLMAVIVYSVALQRKAVRAQRTGMSSVSESLELQRRAEARIAESLKLQERSIELEEQMLAELRKLNERR
jgi:hypothetical protein